MTVPSCLPLAWARLRKYSCFVQNRVFSKKVLKYVIPEGTEELGGGGR